MHFSQAMISLVQEIRRRAPVDIKPRIKFSNDNLAMELIPLYQSSQDVVIRTLIRELFQLGGDSWQPWRLDQFDDHPGDHETTRYVTRTYRGQTHRVAVNEATQPAASKSPRIYRGQVVK